MIKVILSIISIFYFDLSYAYTVNDHEKAAQAVLDKRIEPAFNIVQKIQEEYQARVIEIDLMEKGEAIMYKFYLLNDQGQLQYIFIDATNGSVISSYGVRFSPPAPNNNK